MSATSNASDAVRRGFDRGRRQPFGVRRVRHDEEAIGLDPPDDDVVDDVRVVGIEQVRVLRAPGPDAAEVVGEQPLQRVARARAARTRRCRGATRRTPPRARGTRGAPRARRCTAAASPSRRTAPCARRAPRAARRAGCSAARLRARRRSVGRSRALGRGVAAPRDARRGARGRAAAAAPPPRRRRRAATAARARTSRAGAGSRVGTARGSRRRDTARAAAAPSCSSW